jgi:hypothetical protein
MVQTVLSLQRRAREVVAHKSKRERPDAVPLLPRHIHRKLRETGTYRQRIRRHRGEKEAKMVNSAQAARPGSGDKKNIRDQIDLSLYGRGEKRVQTTQPPTKQNRSSSEILTLRFAVSRLVVCYVPILPPRPYVLLQEN